MNVSPQIDNYIKIVALLNTNNRTFNGGLDGIGLNELIILYHLATHKNALRRIDVAELLGLTASGITRILNPMEKIGLITKEQSAQDARASIVQITESGKRNLSDKLQSLQNLADRTQESLRELE